MANRNLDAKHERVLKALLRLPENKRCAVCDTLGPQYVVVDFSTFVCTICSGVHRQFSHRCKGISMATFKPEEVRALEEGGNGVALARFLAKWTPRDAPKPVDRNVAKIRDWIDLVFVKKRFYSKDVAYVQTMSRTQSTSSARSTASRENDFGFKTVSGLPANGPSTSQGHSDTQRTTSEAGSLIDLELAPSPAPAAAVTQLSPAPVTQAPQSAMPAHSGWDTFGDTGGGATVVAPAAPQPEVQGWSTFEEPAASTSAPAASTESSASGAFHGWQAFDTAQPSVPSGPSAVEPVASRGPVMKELPSDLFSEPVAPPYKAPQPVPGAVPYGQLGAPLGQAGVPLHPSIAPGYIAYPLQPTPMPPGYLGIDQQYFLSSPGVAPGPAASPAQHAAAARAQPLGSNPEGTAPQHAPLPGNDVFSSLVPGLRSSLPAAPLPSLVAAASSNGGVPAYPPQYGAPQRPAHFVSYGALQMGEQQQFGPPAAVHSNGAFGGQQSSATPFFQDEGQPGGFGGAFPGQSSFGAPAESKPKRGGGNPFA